LKPCSEPQASAALGNTRSRVAHHQHHHRKVVYQ
jgi:hypothetical protein